ncbi:hypothetical protein CFP56_019125 [Quercus suber]|uniref:Uncharacterized protein n=1 Tax=Quercus suber TaxID=58331 RepID=A0AAW0M1D6_QUESU
MNVRKRLRSLGIKKAPGCSWIELESNVINRFNHFMGVALLAQSSPRKLQRVRWTFYRLRHCSQREESYAIKREGKDYVLAEI